jgi:phage portal protein BeeE
MRLQATHSHTQSVVAGIPPAPIVTSREQGVLFQRIQRFREQIHLRVFKFQDGLVGVTIVVGRVSPTETKTIDNIIIYYRI